MAKTFVFFSVCLYDTLVFDIEDERKIKVQNYTFFSLFSIVTSKKCIFVVTKYVVLVMKKFSNLLIFALLFVWQLPQNIVALVWLAMSRPVRKIASRHYSVAFSARMPKGAGGVSLGSIVIISRENVNNQFVLRHELDGHTVDSKIFGPLYLLVVGLPSALHLIWHRRFGKGRSYYDFYTERWANRHARLR